MRHVTADTSYEYLTECLSVILRQQELGSDEDIVEFG